MYSYILYQGYPKIALQREDDPDMLEIPENIKFRQDIPGQQGPRRGTYIKIGRLRRISRTAP